MPVVRTATANAGPTKPKFVFRPVVTLVTRTAPKTDAEKKEVKAQVDATIERHKNGGFPLEKRESGQLGCELYCKARIKTGCEFEAWVFKDSEGAWCEGTSGLHNHNRSFLYEYAIKFDLDEKRWKVTDPPDSYKFDSLREVDCTVYNTVNAASIRDGSFDVMVSSAPYHASEHHKYPALLNIRLRTYMVLQASPVLLDMIRSAHEQGDGKALATEQFKQELLRFLVSSTRLSKERI